MRTRQHRERPTSKYGTSRDGTVGVVLSTVSLICASYVILFPGEFLIDGWSVELVLLGMYVGFVGGFLFSVSGLRRKNRRLSILGLGVLGLTVAIIALHVYVQRPGGGH